MSRFFLSLFLFFLVYTSHSQVIDKTRLEYDEELLEASQVGMAVSQDMHYAAFVLDNKELRILDLQNGRFIKTSRLDFLVLNEIAFTQDGNGLLVIEPNRFRLMDWRKETELISQSTEEMISSIGVGKSSNHFAIVSGKKIEIWNASLGSLQTTLEFKKPPLSVSFNPRNHELIVNPAYSAFKPRMFVYNYLNGQQMQEYRKKYTAYYDDFSSKVFLYQNRPVGTAISVPTFRHASLTNDEDYSELYIYGIVKGESTESREDLGAHHTVIRAGDKVLGARHYLGFSVFDLNEQDKVFTTQTSYRKRSTSASSIRKYRHNPHYRLSNTKILINAYGDNINQIYSADQNTIIGYIFMDARGSYAVVSRDGRFDGTPDAAEKLYWTTRKKANKTKLESTFSQRFSPGLLRELIQGNKVIAELDMDAQLEGLPVLLLESMDGQVANPEEAIPNFSVNSKTANLKIRVTEHLTNISELKLFQNNKLVSVINKPKDINEFQVRLTNTFGERNYFYFQASSKKGLETEKQKFIVNYMGRTDEKPKLYLLSIGINEYKNPRYNLNYAISDANGFSASMSQGASGIFEEIREISIRDTEFTKTGLMQKFTEIVAEAKEQDLFIFYYAGHGVMSETTTGPPEFYLVPHDVTQLYGRDELLREKAISANELREISKNINAQKQLFILDACQSAGALDAMVSRGVSEERAIAQLARSTGTFWITAAGSEQFATEFEALGHGVFTYVLLEGLSGKADGANPDQRITVRELSAYLELRVPEISEQYKGKPQYPAGYSFGNDFPIVIYE